MTTSHHDKFFKKMFSGQDLARDFLANYLPAVAEQFIEEGIQKSVLINAREAVIENIEIRFGQVPNEITESISGLSDMGLLKALHKQAILAKNLDKFVQALKKSKN
ncbi:MAG: Rpn family recombination-promoting nuclease/putative transposase [Deltaproteobacteria bacterium]|nr:Rpn family recombination-promoting nuclease/putative transposase [Deltaproteobacteria bacterium]